MDALASLDRLEALLAEERGAIRRLDGAAVEAAANEKLVLVQSLTSAPAAQHAALAPRFRKIVLELRRNGALLVHGRALLRDLLRLRGAAVPMSKDRFAQKPVARGSRVSIQG
jgi:hypothetical protein